MRSMKKKDIKRKKKKRGFTLIELLAVIIILGVLMIIAIPSVTEYIQTSRKSSYVQAANQYISGARTEVNSGKVLMYDTNTTYYLPASCVSLEKGGDSPFGELEEAYIVVTYNGNGYDYYWTSRDAANMGIYLTSEDLLNNDVIQTGVTSISTDIGVGDRTQIMVLKDTCTTNDVEEKEATETIEEKSSFDGESIDTPLYFGKKYEVLIDGYVVSYVFYEDGSAKGYFECELDTSFPIGTFQYVDNTIVGEDGVLYISKNKKKLTIKNGEQEIVFALNNTDNSCYYSNLAMLDRRDNEVFEQYKSQIKTITFESTINIPTNIDDEHKWDISLADNGMVMAYIKPNEVDSSYYDLYIQANGKIYAPKDSANLFIDFEHLETINNMGLLDTSYVVDMFGMFVNCKSLKSLDLSNFNTSKVTNMAHMFSGCSSLTNLDLRSFNTSRVTEMYAMFKECSSLTSLNLRSFNTSKVTSLSNMFYDCNKLTELNISNFDTSNVTSMNYMFYRCSSLTSLDVGNFNTSKVTDMAGMFRNCSRLTSLDLKNFDTTNVNSMGVMFQSCSKLESLDISSFDISKVVYYSSMFSSVSATCSVKVKDSATQAWVLNNSNGHNSLWNSNNVTYNK